MRELTQACETTPGLFGDFRHIPEIVDKKGVKYAIKTVIYKSWDWVRPPPPLLGQIPNFNRKFVLGAPLIACQQSRIPNSLLIALGPHFEISEPK